MRKDFKRKKIYWRTKHNVKYSTITSERYPDPSTVLDFDGAHYSADLFYENLANVQQKLGKNNLVYKFKGEGLRCRT